jgi:hypothetical protein
MEKQRRDFLKITAAGAAGLALTRRSNMALAAWPGTGTMAVNPSIDNMRVVACSDPQMMKPLTQATYAAEQKLVDSCQVQANMDAMAMQLAQVGTADAAWKAIFRSSKAWSATKVAIKINGIEPRIMASVAVIEKFCNVFTGLGVLPANIFIYDGSSLGAAGIPTLAAYFSATDTTKIPGVVGNNSILGGTTNAPIPGGSSAACTANIANGTIDILVNIANNKGHNLAWTGYTTLSMKNHFGTFPPTHDLNYMFNINKSDALLGGTYVRQQLCFVDSLLAISGRMNTGSPDKQPNYLIMGVFGPAVDYLTVKKVREAVLGSTHTDATIDSYLTTFGYATTDPVWVMVPAATGATCTGGGTGGTGGGTGGAGGGSGASGGTSGSGGARSGGTTSGSGGTASGGNNASGGAASGGNNASGGAASGGNNASGGAASGGNNASGGTASGGNNASGGTASGGNNASGGARTGGNSASGGVASGGNNASGGTASGGSNASGGVASGGNNASGGAASGGTNASGGAASGGGASSGGGGTGGAATSVASGGSANTGGTSAGAGTGGSSGSTVASQNSGSGCDVAGVDRRVTRWGAMLAFGAVVAEKLRRLVSDSDRSS